MTVLGHKRAVDHKDGHALLEEERHVRLACGHEKRGVSIITYPDGRKGYYCHEGCGIQRATRRLG